MFPSLVLFTFLFREVEGGKHQMRNFSQPSYHPFHRWEAHMQPMLCRLHWANAGTSSKLQDLISRLTVWTHVEWRSALTRTKVMVHSNGKDLLEWNTVWEGEPQSIWVSPFPKIADICTTHDFNPNVKCGLCLLIQSAGIWEQAPEEAAPDLTKGK